MKFPNISVRLVVWTIIAAPRLECSVYNGTMFVGYSTIVQCATEPFLRIALKSCS